MQNIYTEVDAVQTEIDIPVIVQNTEGAAKYNRCIFICEKQYSLYFTSANSDPLVSK